MACSEHDLLSVAVGTPCPCETESASEHSPGIVKDCEILARQIFSPIHFNSDTGKVKPAAFSDVKDKGLSLNRIGIASREHVVRLGYRKQQKDRENGKSERIFLGVVESQCSLVRNISDETGRCFCVIDTAKPDDKSHADACQVGKQKKARKQLYDTFSKQPIPPQDYK